MQHQKSQLEFSLRHATETCQALSQSLHLERDKVRELESRLNELYPELDSWLQRLNQEKHMSGCAYDKETMERLLLENQRQRELIYYLQSILQAREQTVQDLRSTLDQLSHRLPEENTSRSGLFRSSVCSSEESEVEIITDAPSTRSWDLSQAILRVTRGSSIQFLQIYVRIFLAVLVAYVGWLEKWMDGYFNPNESSFVGIRVELGHR